MVLKNGSLNDRGKWEKTIANAVNLGEAVGMSEDSVEKISF